MSEGRFDDGNKGPHDTRARAKLSVGRWFKRVGDPVTVQEPLVEIDTDNVTHDVLTPVTAGCYFGEGRRVRQARHIARYC
jgi:hypothetical protein